MVGNHRPGLAVVDLGALDVKAAHVDAIEAKNRRAAENFTGRPATPPKTSTKPRRWARWSSVWLRQSLKSPAMMRGVGLGQAFEVVSQGGHLLFARAAEQGEVDADAMNLQAAGGGDAAMEQAAPFELEVGDVLVVGVDNGKARGGWRCRGGRGHRPCCGRRPTARRLRQETRAGANPASPWWRSAWPRCRPWTSCRKTMSGIQVTQALAQPQCTIMRRLNWENPLWML